MGLARADAARHFLTMQIFRRHLAPLLASALALCAQSTTPAVKQTPPAQSFTVGGGPAALDLRNYFELPGVTGQVAQVDTALGKFNLELFAADTPKTVANFLQYVDAGRYTNTIIHRVVPGFVVQMGEIGRAHV